MVRKTKQLAALEASIESHSVFLACAREDFTILALVMAYDLQIQSGIGGMRSDDEKTMIIRERGGGAGGYRIWSETTIFVSVLAP